MPELKLVWALRNRPGMRYTSTDRVLVQMSHDERKITFSVEDDRVLTNEIINTAMKELEVL